MTVHIPEEMRPAQLGLIALGRVTIGHLGATLVDLARRGQFAIEEIGEGDGWTLRTTGHEGDLSGYEATLAAGFRSTVRLWDDIDAVGDALDAARRALLHEAKRDGWLRHWPRSGLTDRGEELRTRVRRFHRNLRHEDIAESLFPYALLFGLAKDDGSPLRRFHAEFVEVGRELPGWAPPAPQAVEYEPIDFTDHKQFGGMPGGMNPGI